MDVAWNLFHSYEVTILNQNIVSCYIFLRPNILKGAAEIPAVDLSRLNTWTPEHLKQYPVTPETCLPFYIGGAPGAFQAVLASFPKVIGFASLL